MRTYSFWYGSAIIFATCFFGDMMTTDVKELILLGSGVFLVGISEVCCCLKKLSKD